MRVLALIAALFSTTASADTFLTYGFIGATYHGFTVDKELAEEMPNRLTDDGKLVWHPRTAFLKLETKNSMLYVGTVRECFDEKAYIVGLGPNWQMGKTWSLSMSVGGYLRDKHYFYDENDRLAHVKDLPFVIDMDEKELIPFVFASATKRFFLTDNFGLEASLVSNIILTHAQLGVFADL